MDLKNHRTDPVAENSGVKLFFDETTWFRLASLGCLRYKQVYNEKLTELRKKNRPLTLEETLTLNIEAYAEAIITDWGGVLDGGEPVPYSKAKAVEIMTTCPSVREFIFAACSTHENFLAHRTEAAKEQLGETSAGS